MDVIGLTGGIASGKSTVAQMMRARGVAVIDADELAREVVMPGTPGLARIVERFGEGVLEETGALDRKALAAIVFADAERRAELNAIVHPLVAERFQERAALLADRGVERVVYEVPLLFENGLDRFMNATILVAVPLEVQRARLMARDAIDAAAADQRIAAQLSLDEKARKATVVVDNSGTREETERAIAAAWQRVAGTPLGKPDKTTG